MPASTQQPPSLTHSPLLGKTILITRAKDQAAEVVKLLEQLGASVVLFPTIQIVPPTSWEECDKTIAALTTYDAIIFTSINAVENFFSRVNERDVKISENVASKSVYAIGETTKRSLEQRNIRSLHIPGVHDVKQLAIALSRTDVSGKRFLFPKGNLAGNVITFALREHGALVDEVIVYETIQPSNAESGAVRKRLEEKQVDVITFFSPSSISNFLAMIPQELVEGFTIAAIGHTTSAAAKNLSLPVHIVAEQATSASLVASIVKYYE